MNETSIESNFILASGSASRATILRQACVAFEKRVSGVDEDALKLRHQGAPAKLACALAKAKALAVCENDGRYILGADQLLQCEDRLFDKPRSREEARTNLMFLRGKTHYLINGLSLCCDGEEVWSFTNHVSLTMRHFSDEYLDLYIENEGDSILSSVGCYRLEAMGAQLFTHIEGDYFSTLGLPLLPLLEELRNHDIIQT